MNRIFYYLLLLLLVMTFTSCHSNEQNYKAAYDKAMEKYRDGVGAEEYERILAEKVKPTAVVNGDSIILKTMHVNVTDDSVSVLKPYSVIVAQFKQKFNAITMRDRLHKEEGFKSYVLFGGPDKKYFVAVKGFDELDVATAFLKNIDKGVKMKVLEPKAWILERL
ncbi:MAG: hypothetical protein J6S96_06680 [Muribaculaceae bacterium]|nr:hypothetical protein [Muribaculaceae bacterium]